MDLIKSLKFVIQHDVKFMSHLSCIGFHSESDQVLRQIAMKAFERAEPIVVGAKFYMYFRDESGAELWLQFDKEKHLIGLNPHYDVAECWMVGLEAVVEDGQNPMDGSFFGEVFPDQPRGKDSGLFPILFAAPDFAKVQKLVFPTEQEVWVCASARSIEILNCEESLSPTYDFQPSGMYRQDGTVSSSPQAIAEITAVITSTNSLTNHLTHQQFYVMQVVLYSRTLTVVVDPALLKEGCPNTGDWVKGSFWISGRLKNCLSSRPKEAWWSKFFTFSRNRD